MKSKELNLHTLYTQDSRESWAGFGGHLSIAVSEEEAKAVEGLNDYLSVEEVETIYIPLVRLLHLHVTSAARRNQHVNVFLKHPHSAKIPFIIGIAATSPSAKARRREFCKSFFPVCRTG